MGSEQNDGTSVPPSEPKLCANGCGFFGTAANMNLCSKCYRDLRVTEEQAASAKAAMERTLSLKSKEQPISTVSDSVSPDSSSPAKGVVEAVEEQKSDVKVPSRCFRCNKKVGVMRFKCKCGSTFCGSHRYPESHECEFDFKTSGRDAIAKANPVVKSDKVERF